MAADRDVVETIRAELARQAAPDRAPAMQAYMKSSMPYLGVRVPVVRAVVRDLARAHPPADAGTLRATARALWDGATHREERYAALALLDAPPARPLRDPGFLDLYEYLVTDGAWWDLVDAAVPQVGALLLTHPAQVRPVLRRWSRAPDRWLRRAAIISQVGHRTRTDAALLAELVEPNTGDREFFVRKAIGWALRDYARTDPAWVRGFVATHDLQPLSRREATKHL